MPDDPLRFIQTCPEWAGPVDLSREHASQGAVHPAQGHPRHCGELRDRRSVPGQHSIRVNDQFRMCFRWTAAGAEDVEIVDYH
ncbi:MAG: type II toxin-antitoxin system RelE/ParE family toxin [candidate division NC10 bacterium]|nr:type II toxin-antitoxin system RelE/ParE family toxin [candidate division NC10 bacterium]